MDYLKTILAVLLIGTPNFIFQEGFISGADATIPGFCEAYTDILKVWREEESKVPANVQFVTYAKAPSNSGSGELFQKISAVKDYDDVEFDPSINRVAVIIHGFTGNYTNPWIQDLIRALFSWQEQQNQQNQQNLNMRVIVVDWSKSYSYYAAAGAVNEVSAHVALALYKLSKHYVEQRLEKPYLHIMGHSLGAHIAGLAAKTLDATNRWTVDRVTGFDPAKPLFNIGDEFAASRLDKSHAKFVDVIHTNGLPGTSTFGLYDAVGHVDFYPGGGDYQPACAYQRGLPTEIIQINETCEKTAVQDCLIGLGNDLACIASKAFKFNIMVCDHSQAQEYFIQSLYGQDYKVNRFGTSDEFPCSRGEGLCCGTKIPMGINAAMCIDEIYHGQYYVEVQVQYIKKVLGDIINLGLKYFSSLVSR